MFRVQKNKTKTKQEQQQPFLEKTVHEQFINNEFVPMFLNIIKYQVTLKECSVTFTGRTFVHDF